MFFDDSQSRFLGYQDSNIFTITGYTITENGVPELIFTNLPPEMAGETIYYYNEITYEKGEYTMTVKQLKRQFIYRLDEYSNVKDRNSDWSISDQYNTKDNINSLSKGVLYKISLRWGEYKADYYVVFDIDPSQINFDQNSNTLQ